jgi:hypothetical protein
MDAKSRQIVGCLRGHGRVCELVPQGTYRTEYPSQAIRSIAVHSTFPGLFCTTSQDFTTRIYDLELRPKQVPNNPPWPSATIPSKAGAAHGLDMTMPEGVGVGQCVAVLVGERSGGHQADVLGAVRVRFMRPRTVYLDTRSVPL